MAYTSDRHGRVLDGERVVFDTGLEVLPRILAGRLNRGEVTESELLLVLTNAKSLYVKRTRREDGKVGWTGSIRSAAQAEKERAAWENAGWDAEVRPNTPEVRREVRAWEQARAEATPRR